MASRELLKKQLEEIERARLTALCTEAQLLEEMRSTLYVQLTGTQEKEFRA